MQLINVNVLMKYLFNFQTCCPTLEMIDVSNCIFSTDYLTFNIEKFQIGCPNLVALHLANSRVRAPYAAAKMQVCNDILVVFVRKIVNLYCK